MPEAIEFGPAVGAFVDVIAKKVHPRSIEIGYEPEANGEDPLPGEPATWYVEVTLSSVLKVRKRARGIGPETVLEALAAAAEALGLSVRLRYTDRDGHLNRRRHESGSFHGAYFCDVQPNGCEAKPFA